VFKIWGTGQAVDSSNNIYMSGIRLMGYGGDIDFNSTGATTCTNTTSIYSSFMVKVDSSGNCIWVKSYVRALGNALTIDSNANVYLGGTYGGSEDFGGGVENAGPGGDGFIVKYSSTGNYTWIKHFNIVDPLGGQGARPGVYGLAIDNTGTKISATGSFNTNDVNFGCSTPFTTSGYDDIFVSQYDTSNGSCLWVKSFGGPIIDIAKGITTDNNGNVSIIGITYSSLNFGGGPITTYSIVTGVIASFTSSGMYRYSNSFDIKAGNTYGLTSDTLGSLIGVGSFSATANFLGTMRTSVGQYDLFNIKFAP